MAQHKTAVTPVHMHWSYCSLTLSHRYADLLSIRPPGTYFSEIQSKQEF